jgi:hypothetical protein
VGEGGIVFFQLVALLVGEARGPTDAQRHAVQPLLVRLEHGEDPVYRSPSRRQLKLSDHARKAPDFFDQRLRRHRSKRHAEPGHSLAHCPSKLGYVLDELLADGLRLALGIPSLVQGSHVLLPSHLGLLQLSLDL